MVDWQVCCSNTCEHSCHLLLHTCVSIYIRFCHTCSTSFERYRWRLPNATAMQFFMNKPTSTLCAKTFHKLRMFVISVREVFQSDLDATKQLLAACRAGVVWQRPALRCWLFLGAKCITVALAVPHANGFRSWRTDMCCVKKFHPCPAASYTLVQVTLRNKQHAWIRRNFHFNLTLTSNGATPTQILDISTYMYVHIQ